jgi:hypothetical protein
MNNAPAIFRHIHAPPPERGCVIDQPQQLLKTSLLKYA